MGLSCFLTSCRLTIHFHVSLACSFPQTILAVTGVVHRMRSWPLAHSCWFIQHCNIWHKLSCWQCMCNGTLWYICILYYLIYPVPDTISFEESAVWWFNVASNNKMCLCFHVECLIFFPQFEPSLEYQQIVIEVLNIKFHRNLFIGSRSDTCRQADRQMYVT